MKLSISQRDECFDVLVACGLKPEKFDWEQLAGEFSMETERMRLKRIGRSQYFEINQAGLRTAQEYNCRFTPGEKESIEEHERIGWPTVLTFFKKWCTLLDAREQARDKWGEIASQFDSTRILTHPTDEQKFTEAEFQDIVQRMDVLKQKIKILAFPNLYLQLAVTTLDRITGHARVLNKFDWKSLLAGTIANLTFVLEMPPHISSAFWERAKEVFDDFLAS